MHICLVTPAPPKSRKGNRVTAERWAGFLRKLGHRVAVHEQYDGGAYDLFIGLHARKSHRSIARFHREHPRRPLLVALTGTDLYHDIHRSATAKRSLKMATRLIVLQAHGIEELPKAFRSKVRVIHQSVDPLKVRPVPLRDVFEVCVMGHLRAVKDPFRVEMAARRLSSESRVRITHVGAALSESMRQRATKLTRSNPRYRWLGEVSRGRAMRILARSRLMVLTSKMEGGANVVGEALTVGVPVVSSRIGGTIGMLGADYPGYFPVGDTAALAELLQRAEEDEAFLKELQRRCAKKAALFRPQHELRSWRRLLRELSVVRSLRDQ